MAIISRRQYDHPALATAGGSALHASISNLYTVLGDDSMSRYKAFTAVANSSVGVIAHEFGLDFANLKVQIFTGTYPALTLVSDPIGTGWTVAATTGLASRSIDVTAPASGGPHTYAVLVSHESNATQFIPGLVSIGAQTFAGAKTFLSPILSSLGAVGAPGYSFTGDTNTGMWSSAADTLSFSTAGVKALEISPSGVIIVGPTTGTNIHSFQGSTAIVQVRSDGSNAAAFRFSEAGTYKGQISYTDSTEIIAFETSTLTAGQYTQAGAWTLGPALTNTNHTINARGVFIIAESTTAQTLVRFSNSSLSNNSFVGQDSSVGGQVINGSGAYSLGLAGAAGIAFSGNGGSTLHGSMTAAGAWTFGKDDTSTATHTMYGSGALTVRANHTGLQDLYLHNENGTAASGSRLLVSGNVGNTRAVVSAITGQAIRIGSFSNSDVEFVRNNTSVVGGYDTAGAWTLGVSGDTSTNVQTMYGETLRVRGPSSGTSLSLYKGGTQKGAFGVNDAGPAGTDGIYFYNTAYVGAISTAGAWTLGASAAASTNAVFHTSNAWKHLILNTQTTSASLGANLVLQPENSSSFALIIASKGTAQTGALVVGGVGTGTAASAITTNGVFGLEFGANSNYVGGYSSAGAWTWGPDSVYTVVHKHFGTQDNKTAQSVGVGAIFRSATSLASGESLDAVQAYDNTVFCAALGVAKTTNTSNRAGYLTLKSNNGTVYYLWVTDAGVLRYSSTQAHTGGQATGTAV